MVTRNQTTPLGFLQGLFRGGDRQAGALREHRHRETRGQAQRRLSTGTGQCR
jgi:hypothetical protein